jgi:hypothetical protein
MNLLGCRAVRLPRYLLVNYRARLRQLRNVGGDATGFVAREQISGRATRLAVVVPDDEAGGTRFSVAISPKKSQNSCSRAMLVGLSSYRTYLMMRAEFLGFAIRAILLNLDDASFTGYYSAKAIRP